MPITELRIEGLRTIEKLRLELDGLTVLIGDNGTGKSSILEACELLRRVPGERFVDEFYGIHGGMAALLRQGSPALKVGVTLKPVRGEYPHLEDDDWFQFESIDYDLSLIAGGAFASLEETLRFKLPGYPNPRAVEQMGKPGRPAPERKHDIWRKGNRCTVWDHGHEDHFELDSHATFLSESRLYNSDSPVDIAAKIAAIHLRNIRVHLPFEVMPSWAARALDRKSALRTSMPFAPAEQLERLGINLANTYQALKNNFGQQEWRKTLEYVRLGLGDHIEDVTTWPDPGGGSIGLSLKLKNLDRQIPSSQLSDGMLSYLAFVALFRLQGTRPSLMGLDEPDLHLHPKLLMRVLDMFESAAREFPLLVATHSDRLLDGLSNPARSVVLCELDERQTTRLLRPDPKALEKWLERYRGLGDIRAAGHEASVLTREEPS